MTREEIDQGTYDLLQKKIDNQETCKWCKFAVTNREMYWTEVCTRYEKKIVVNSDYSTCENFKERKDET